MHVCKVCFVILVICVGKMEGMQGGITRLVPIWHGVDPAARNIKPKPCLTIGGIRGHRIRKVISNFSSKIPNYYTRNCFIAKKQSPLRPEGKNLIAFQDYNKLTDGAGVTFILDW
jgi:hypothetical protein